MKARKLDRIVNVSKATNFVLTLSPRKAEILACRSLIYSIKTKYQLGNFVKNCLK